MPEQKTQAEIDAELVALRALRGRIRTRTAFGDDNNAALEAEIAIISGKDRIAQYDRATEYISGAACYADNWRLGHEDEAPSEDWQGLVIEPLDDGDGG